MVPFPALRQAQVPIPIPPRVLTSSLSTFLSPDLHLESLLSSAAHSFFSNETLSTLRIHSSRVKSPPGALNGRLPLLCGIRLLVSGGNHHWPAARIGAFQGRQDFSRKERKLSKLEGEPLLKSISGDSSTEVVFRVDFLHLKV